LIIISPLTPLCQQLKKNLCSHEKAKAIINNFFFIIKSFIKMKNSNFKTVQRTTPRKQKYLVIRRGGTRLT